MSLSPQPQAARARATAAQPAEPEHVLAARKADEAVLSQIEKNPVYGIIFQGSASKEDRIAKVVAYLTEGVAEGTAKPEDLDRRRKQLSELNAAIQVLRKQLGSEQAKEITSKAYADFQRIVNETSDDVEQFEGELAPLCQLADLFSKYGVDGDLIGKINQAKEQQRLRRQQLDEWDQNHANELLAYQRSITALKEDIAQLQTRLDNAWVGKASLQAQIANKQADLEERQREYAVAQDKTLPEPVVQNGDAEPVNEEILELQNIGGEKFRTAITTLRQHTEEALAKISLNFDEAVQGLTNARESFIIMDRNCGDATFALSVLQVAVQQAEQQCRDAAQKVTASDAQVTGAMADLEKMEREQRSGQILGYNSALTTFLTDVGIAVTSLRSGQTVIQNVLRMNEMALEQANTHKITGIANTADAVTITIGSIIEVCNRAASQALADGLNRMRRRAQEGSARLVGGTVESIQQQNTQLASFIESVADLRQMTHEISANSVELLRQQFALVAKMREESSGLADASTEAQHAAFSARAGIGVRPNRSLSLPRAVPSD